MGALSCSLIYSPGSKVNYNVGDHVSVLVMMSFGGVEMKFQNVMLNAKHYILGMLDRAVTFSSTPNKFFFKRSKDLGYFNRQNDTGVIAGDDGSITFITRGAVKSLLKPFGYGIYENMKQDTFQNYHRVISHNPPYLAREYFGLYKGKNQDDKVSKTQPSDSLLCYKRFVTQSMDPSSWVSTCEGTWNPWVGANNNAEEIKKGKNILWTKIINSGTGAVSKRITIEAGEEGSQFYNFRIDKIVQGEKSIPVIGGATPAVSGNTFKLNISEDGEIELRAASAGIPLNNFSGFKFKLDKQGNLIINSKGSIVLSHGDTDKSISSIELDGKGGININALGGLKVNGKPLVSQEFLTAFINNIMTMFTVPSFGPAIPNPAFVALLQTFGVVPATRDASTNGYTTAGLPVAPPITGIQADADYHETSSS
jgi:hypothetical protein